MNILFFLTPKVDVGFVYSSDTVGEAAEKMLGYRFTTVPVINEVSGKYEGTLANDDLLREFYTHQEFTLAQAGEKPLRSLFRRRDYDAVRADADIEDLLDFVTTQNFVPVVDDTNTFIGIITRREVMRYLRRNRKEEN